MILQLIVDANFQLHFAIVGGYSDRNRSRSRIINEDKEPPNIYPWLAAVKREYSLINTASDTSLCTGSLISETYVYLSSSYILEFTELQSKIK